MRHSPAWPLMVLICATGVCSSDELKVPIFLNKPERLATRTWPVSVGIPFKKGEFRDEKEMTMVDGGGKTVPCEIVKTGDWEHGSLRWVRAEFTADFSKKYFLTRGARPQAKDDIKVQQNTENIVIETGGAQYTFTKGSGTFDTIRLDVNHDGRFGEDETLVSKAADGFYFVDSHYNLRT